jgi:hypothetical protein
MRALDLEGVECGADVVACVRLGVALDVFKHIRGRVPRAL